MSSATREIQTRVRRELLEAVRTTRTVGGAVLVDGRPVCPAPPLNGIPELSVSALAAALYTRWYAQWHPPGNAALQTPEVPGVLGVVRAWHAATSQFEPGWMVQAVYPSRAAVVVRGADQRTIQPADYVNLARRAAPLRPGDSVAVTKRRDSEAPEDSWWFTWGASGPATAAPLLRTYWNANPAFIGPLVGALTTVMEDASLPYMLKCPAATALFGRSDSVVLYFDAASWDSLKRNLRSGFESVAAHLRPQTPRLALPLAPGVAIAEDPGAGRSFGETRSRAVADGILHALAARIAGPEAVVDAILARLESHGIRPDSPHLQAGSTIEAIEAW